MENNIGVSADTEVLVSLYCDMGYGIIEGLFVCTLKELNTLKEATVDFGEVLGKHSEVVIEDIYSYCDVVTDDAILIEQLKRVFGSKTMCGYNPLEELDEEFKLFEGTERG